ncbi:MAG TPA: hypothetical protein VEK57_17200 [Thermoanaerobaculia bacterium]|nr:hypothetical protein [Thermoanaerobaculia bacterium]
MSKNYVLFAAIVLFIAAVVLAPMHLVGSWRLTAVLLAVTGFIMIAGQAIAGSPFAALIGSLNTMSLSRTQTVLWTILVCASFITVAFVRLGDTGSLATALDFAIPQTVLGLIGVSLTSAVASSVVASSKASKSPAAGEVTASAANTETPMAHMSPRGTLFGYSDKSKASLSDIFDGDELADAHTLDLGKVQMFFFTIVAAVLFLGDIYAQLMKGVPTALPNLPSELVALMGMSHAGYLGNKLVNRTAERTSQTSTVVTPSVSDTSSTPVMVTTTPPAADQKLTI